MVKNGGKRSGPTQAARQLKSASQRFRSVATRPFIPQDRLTDSEPDLALAADLIELTAFFAPSRKASLGELTSALEIGQDEYRNVDEVLQHRDRLTSDTAAEIQRRAAQLEGAYPFALSATGGALTFDDTSNWGRTLYILSLVLSHLPSERSPVLEQADLLPTDDEIVKLRRWFQYCAAASVAAEIGGRAWAFGWPRPDNSGFLDKLKEIWQELRDGDVRDVPPPGSPKNPKDDEIDIIAARVSCDGLHGFPIILGQVASGDNWKSKPLRAHADHVFYPEWFSLTPASQTMVYHVIPFTVDPTYLRRETRRLGHLMHRVRLCHRAYQADQEHRRGSLLKIEGIESFKEVSTWTIAYRSRAAHS